jgi:hypothetical protein
MSGMNYMTSGTIIFPVEPVKLVKIGGVSFQNETIVIRLTDGRAVQLDMAQHRWLRWLLTATPEQRSRWEIVPSGGGVWWTELDEGIELQPLLDLQPLD